MGNKEQIYGRNDMVMLDKHNKIYGSLGIAEPYVFDTKTGETVIMENPKKGKFEDVVTEFSVYGKSTQVTTKGAQLFDVSKGGAGWIDTETGEFVTSNDNYVSDFIKVSPAAQYHINYPHPLNYMYTYNSEKVFLRKESYDFTFITGEDVEYIRFAISNSADGALETANGIMFNAGSEELPWEPYTGGHPSPSPDYPQEIKSAGDDGSIGVDVTGANLADVDNAFVDNYPDESPEKIENGFILDAIDMSHRLIRVPCKTKKGNKYTFKFDYEKLQGNENALLSIVLQGGDGAPQYIPIGGTVVCNSDREYFSIYTDSNNIGARFKVTNVICNQGDTIYSYEPYKQSQTLTVQTPNGLPGIPVTSGGNYTDENGQRWICDEIDFKRGKYVKRVSHKEFTGNETVKLTGYDTVYVIEILDANYELPALCNMFTYIILTNIGIDSTVFSLTPYSKGAAFNLNWIDTPKDVEIAKAWFAQKYAEGNPVKVYYVLATPIETDLTPEQIIAY